MADINLRIDEIQKELAKMGGLIVAAGECQINVAACVPESFCSNSKGCVRLLALIGIHCLSIVRICELCYWSKADYGGHAYAGA